MPPKLIITLVTFLVLVLSDSGRVVVAGSANTAAIMAVTSIVLNKDNFGSHVHGTNDWFIKFFSPVCHHCIANKPVWQAFADLVEADQNELKNLKIGEVDCLAQKGQLFDFIAFWYNLNCSV